MAELVTLLKEEVKKWRSADLVARAREEGATFGPVNDVDAFLEDPHVRHRETVRILEDERFGPTRYLSPPWHFSRTPASIDRHAPRLGEHSDEVLRELGLDELTSFFDAHFDARAPLRRKLASSWWSQADQQASQLESQREDAGAEHAQTDP